jgi:hypothetical protein
VERQDIAAACRELRSVSSTKGTLSGLQVKTKFFSETRKISEVGQRHCEVE